MLSAPGQCLRPPLCLEQFSGPRQPASFPTLPHPLSWRASLVWKPKGWAEMGPHQAMGTRPVLGPQDRDHHAPRCPHQVVLGLGHVGVMGPAQGLVNAQGPGVVPLHLLELALVLAEQGQIVELLGHIRMVGAQDLGVMGSQVIWGWRATCCQQPS